MKSSLPPTFTSIHDKALTPIHDKNEGDRKGPLPTQLYPRPYNERSVDKKFRSHSKGGRGEDVGRRPLRSPSSSRIFDQRTGNAIRALRWRPLRSPSCPKCHMLTLPRDTFIFIRTFNAEKTGSKSVEIHITGIKLQAGIVFVSQLMYLGSLGVVRVAQKSPWRSILYATECSAK
jgi:hypothetical protein